MYGDDYQAADWRPMLSTIRVPMLLVTGTTSGAEWERLFLHFAPKIEYLLRQAGQTREE